MRRRTYLGTLGSLFSATALAGCSGVTADGADDAETPAGSPIPDEPGDSTTTTTDAGTTTDGRQTTTATDGGTASRFAGEPCPSFESSADRTVCYHAADRSSTDVLLTPSSETFSPTTGDGSVETVTFELANASEKAVKVNPYAWRIERRTDAGWKHVAPDAYPEPLVEIDPGQSYRWVLSVQSHPSPHSERTKQVVQDLQSGVYAFGVDGFVGDAENGRVEWVALFEVTRPATATGGA